MAIFNLITLLTVLTAAFAYLNVRFLKLPDTIGIMVIALVFSLVLILGYSLNPAALEGARQLAGRIDFTTVVLDIMLGFLLFAGSLHTDFQRLKTERRSIALMVLIGVLLSTGLIGTLLYGLLALLGQPLDYLYCLLFGALISPTDPIAVISILTQSRVPKSIEIKIVGESLFNDGVGIVVFLTLLEVARRGMASVTLGEVSMLFLREAVGGVLLGWVIGFGLFYLIRSIDHYQTEILITLAAVMGGSVAASWLHVSGPLAIVVAGLLTGGPVKDTVMSEVTEEYVGKFWEVIDVILNALLFVLMGFRLLSLAFQWFYLAAGGGAVLIVLLSRYASIRVPLLLSRQDQATQRRDGLMMTWGGLRGGLSIAMALSIPETFAAKPLLVFITYVIVLFSILVQGLTLPTVVKRLYRSEETVDAPSAGLPHPSPAEPVRQPKRDPG
ncbi:MAG: sodium:proton antiporter [Ferruginibacter sp.]|nr:sodium:proton antiporter [Cytophagales bacterium]